MKSKADIIEYLRNNKSTLEVLGVKSIAIFGSVAKETAHDQSDIDILIEIYPEANIKDIMNVLKSKITREVDLVNKENLCQDWYSEITQTSIQIY